MERAHSTNAIGAMIKSQIQCRLGQPIQAIKVEISDNGLVLSGRVTSYYAKQLAQHVAMKVSPLPLTNEIDVG